MFHFKLHLHSAYLLKLAILINSLAHYTKGTLSLFSSNRFMYTVSIFHIFHPSLTVLYTIGHRFYLAKRVVPLSSSRITRAPLYLLHLKKAIIRGIWDITRLSPIIVPHSIGLQPHSASANSLPIFSHQYSQDLV